MCDIYSVYYLKFIWKLIEKRYELFPCESTQKKNCSYTLQCKNDLTLNKLKEEEDTSIPIWLVGQVGNECTSMTFNTHVYKEKSLLCLRKAKSEEDKNRFTFMTVTMHKCTVSLALFCVHLALDSYCWMLLGREEVSIFLFVLFFFILQCTLSLSLLHFYWVPFTEFEKNCWAGNYIIT